MLDVQPMLLDKAISHHTNWLTQGHHYIIYILLVVLILFFFFSLLLFLFLFLYHLCLVGSCIVEGPTSNNHLCCLGMFFSGCLLSVGLGCQWILISIYILIYIVYDLGEKLFGFFSKQWTISRWNESELVDFIYRCFKSFYKIINSNWYFNNYGE